MRLLRGLIRFIGWKTLFSIGLLIITLVCFIQGLANVLKGIEFPFLFLLVCAGVVTGWGLAAFRLPGWLGGILGVLFGLEAVILRVGRLEGEVLNVVEALGYLIGDVVGFLWNLAEQLWQVVWMIWELFQWRQGELIWPSLSSWRWPSAPEWRVLISPVKVLWESELVLFARAYTWLSDVITGSPAFDPVATALVWGISVWVVSLWAAWIVARRDNVLLAILPAGAVLSNALSYTGAKSGILIPFLGSAVILMAMQLHTTREKRWLATRVDFSRDLWAELLVTASVVSVILMLSSAILPAINLRKVVDFVEEWREARRQDVDDNEKVDQVAESLGLEPQPEPREVPPIDQMRATGLPRSHLIGSGPELSEQIVMVISTGELPVAPDDTLLPFTPPRYYWRSLTYDHYSGRGWSTSGTETIEYEAGELASDVEKTRNQRTVRQRVRLASHMSGIVHVAGTLTSIDQPYKVAWRSNQEIFGATLEVNTYRADSLVTSVTKDELREAKMDYEPWIQERYLQLPEEMSPRVMALARDLTATEPTPFDRALAIETYLRTTFPYTLEVPFPPADQDMADYFLFDLQKGYCDYYATSMVVLARAAGIPARMVIGYITGYYEVHNARYVVSEADAHAWAEVYFPGYGWIEFEPTAGRPGIERCCDAPDDDWPEMEDRDRAPLVPPSEKSNPPLLLWFLGMLGGFVLLIVGITGLDTLWLLLLSPPRAISVLYQRLWRRAGRIWVQIQRGGTPHEFRAAFAESLERIWMLHPDAESVLAPAQDEIKILASLYVRQQFSPCPITRAEQRAAVGIWWWLRWRLLLARFWRRPPRQTPQSQVAEM